MRRIWITKHGDADVLKIKEAADPAPGPGEIVIGTRALGINFADILARIGLYPDAPPIPCVVGYEVAGIVEAVGAGVENFRAGDRVLALTRFGGYSDRVCIPANQAFAMPENMSFEEGAAIPVQYFTAYLAVFFQGNLHRGERILIHSAGGGVGLAAIEMAKMMNAEIFGTASAGKHEFLKEQGVHHTIDYRTQDFEQEVARITGGKGVHLILDAVGGASFAKSYRSLASLGRMVMFGVSSAVGGETRSLLKAAQMFFSLPSFKAIPLMNENRGVFGLNLGRLWEELPALREVGQQVVDWYREGKIKPRIAAAFDFESAPEAHRFLQERKNTGKVVLTVNTGHG